MTGVLVETGEQWVPRIPSDWSMVPAKAAFSERRAPCLPDDVHLTPSQMYGVIPQTEYMEKTGGRVVLNQAGQDNMKHVEPDDFIIHLRSFQGGLERSTVRGKVSTAYTVITPTQLAYPGYFKWLLKSSAYIQELRTTTNQLRDGQSIKYRDFTRVPLPLPPAAMQHAIADYLDRDTAKIDTLIEEQQRLIEMLQERRQAVIDRSATRLHAPSSITDGSRWTEIPFVRCMSSRVDYRGATPTKVDDGIQLITARNVKLGWIDYTTSREFVDPSEYAEIMRRGLPRLDDLLFTMEAPLGNIAIVDRENIALAQRVIKFRTNLSVAIPQFLVYAVQSTWFQAQLVARATGSTALGLKASKLPELRVCLPSIEEQERIAAYIEEQTMKIDTLVAETERFIELSQERRTALITAAVTGQIDVRDQVRVGAA